MDKHKLNEFAINLESQVKALREEVAQAEAIIRAPRPQGGDEIDQAQYLNEGDTQKAMRDRAIGKLKNINVALGRIKAGTFGECQDCGCNIDERRLAVNPAAALCFGCQEEAEHKSSKKGRRDSDEEAA
jgi:DnaK suppressor protein